MVRIKPSIENSANRIICSELKDTQDIMKIEDRTYSIAKAVGKAMGVKERRKGQMVQGGNRRKRQLRKK